jgi:hypothetical protein
METQSESKEPNFKEYNFIEQLESLRSHVQFLIMSKECLEETMIELQDENEQQQEELIELREHFSEHKARLEKQLAQQKSRHEQEIADLKEAHRINIIALQNSLIDARAALASQVSSTETRPPGNRVRCECGKIIAKTSMHKHKLSIEHMVRLQQHV